jgi:hypothetical protein
MSDDSIKMRQEIIKYENEINNYKTKLNILTAEIYNINTIDYEILIKNHKEKILRRIKYTMLFFFFFSIFNLFLYYKNIIKSSKFILLLVIKIIIKILLILYYDINMKLYLNYITNNKIDNNKRLLEINNEKKNIENNILELKIKITNTYKQLEFLTNIK